MEETDDSGFNPDNYDVVELEITNGAFYNSSNGSEEPIYTGIAHQFFITQKFTREDLPVGSVIIVAEGWQYRPEAWAFESSRPVNVTESMVVIDEAWWENYTTRAFNVSLVAQTTLAGYTNEELAAVFKIYIPKA